jgi:hypothetical protein
LLQAAADCVKKIIGTLEHSFEELEERVSKWRQAQDPTAVRAMELEVAAQQRQTADQVTGLALQKLIPP